MDLTARIAIASLGLKKINQNCCLGIKALMDTAGFSAGILDSRRVSFMLAPRVNAAGRMGDAKRAVLLFTTHDPVEARSIAEELNRTNTLRQEVQDAIFNQAVKMIESDDGWESNMVTVAWERAGTMGLWVLWHPNWWIGTISPLLFFR